MLTAGTAHRHTRRTIALWFPRPHTYPASALEQLARDGILVMPIGSDLQDLVVLTKDADGAIRKESQPGFQFVPLMSKHIPQHRENIMNVLILAGGGGRGSTRLPYRKPQTVSAFPWQTYFAAKNIPAHAQGLFV